MDDQIAAIRRDISAGDYSQLAKLAVLECRSGEHVWDNWDDTVQRNSMHRMRIHREISKRFFGDNYQATVQGAVAKSRECFWCGTKERYYQIQLYSPEKGKIYSPGKGETQLIEVRL